MLPPDTKLFRWNTYYVHKSKGRGATSLDLHHERKSLRALHRTQALSWGGASPSKAQTLGKPSPAEAQTPETCPLQACRLRKCPPQYDQRRGLRSRSFRRSEGGSEASEEEGEGEGGEGFLAGASSLGTPLASEGRRGDGTHAPIPTPTTGRRSLDLADWYGAGAKRRTRGGPWISPGLRFGAAPLQGGPCTGSQLTSRAPWA